jgi:hypothetical protein
LFGFPKSLSILEDRLEYHWAFSSGNIVPSVVRMILFLFIQITHTGLIVYPILENTRFLKFDGGTWSLSSSIEKFVQRYR